MSTAAKGSVAKNILVADAPGGNSSLRAALVDEFVVTFTSTLKEAQAQLLARTFDLVVVDVHFDDSRCLDLLNFIRNTDALDQLPFIIVQHRDLDLAHTMPAVKSVAKLLGVCQVLKIGSMHSEKAEQEVRKAVKHCLDKPIREIKKL
jgi:DNA-binding NtrC family response regulator